MNAEARFFAKVRENLDGCWLWVGTTNRTGYGQFSFGSKMVRAHRFSFELLVGPIPDGLHLDHLCKRPGCVNPWHLEPVTALENNRRAYWATLTECKRGHPFTAENTYLTKEGHRECRSCQREHARAYRLAAGIPARPERWRHVA